MLPATECGVGGHPSPSRLRWLHFTGSTATFQRLWRMVAENIGNYRSYPRLVGETGGKDFIVAHPSADPDVLRTPHSRSLRVLRPECSAASRAVARSVWDKIEDDLIGESEALTVGDVRDFSNFTSR